MKNSKLLFIFIFTIGLICILGCEKDVYEINDDDSVKEYTIRILLDNSIEISPTLLEDYPQIKVTVKNLFRKEEQTSSSFSPNLDLGDACTVCVSPIEKLFDKPINLEVQIKEDNQGCFDLISYDSFQNQSGNRDLRSMVLSEDLMRTQIYRGGNYIIFNPNVFEFEDFIDP